MIVVYIILFVYGRTVFVFQSLGILCVQYSFDNFDDDMFQYVSNESFRFVSKQG